MTVSMICGTYAPIMVLVIEQRQSELRSIRKALEDAKVVNVLVGCDTIPACIEYLATVDPPPPDLVIVDLMVIDQGESALLRQLRTDSLASIPVVALGARDSDEALAVDLAADFYVEKPLTPAHIVGIVQACDALDLAIVRTITDPSTTEDDDDGEARGESRSWRS